MREKEKDGVIRYLTPLECERLMGLPDNWTKYDYLGKQASDNARCTALGNAIALPCAEYIMAGIKEVLEGIKFEKLSTTKNRRKQIRFRKISIPLIFYLISA